MQLLNRRMAAQKLALSIVKSTPKNETIIVAESDMLNNTGDWTLEKFKNALRQFHAPLAGNAIV